MNQTKYKVQNSKILKEIYEYSKELQKYGTVGGLISIGAFFCTKMSYILFCSWVSFWVLKYPDVMKAVLISSIVLSYVIVILVLTKYFIQDLNFNLEVKKMLCNSMRKIACLLLFPFELSIYGVKSIIVITYSFRPYYRDLFLDSDGKKGNKYYLIFLAVYFDFLLSVVICYMKSTVLRPLIPNGGFFSKIDGNFEYFFILLIPMKHLFFFLTNKNDVVSIDGVMRAQMQDMLYYSIEIFLMVVITGIYAKELPYYNPISEKVLAHFLLSTFCVFGLLGMFNNDLNITFKIYIFIIPLQIASFEYFLKFVYRIDFMDSKQTRNYKCLKKVMTMDTENSHDLFERIYNQGVFMNHIKKKKLLTQEDLNMWKNVQVFRREFNDLRRDDKDGPEHQMESDHSAELLVEEIMEKSSKANVVKTTLIKSPRNLHEGQVHSSNQGNLRVEDAIKEIENKSQNGSVEAQENNEDDEHSMKQGPAGVKTKLNHIIVNAYTENNKKVPYAHLIRIHWLLTNRVIVFSIFSDLRDLLELATSLKSRFIYYYALKEVETYFANFYQNPEMINLEGNGLFAGLNNKAQGAKANGAVDLAYAFYHKYTIQHLKNMIELFSEKTSKFIEEKFMSANSYKSMHQKVRQLNQMDKVITKTFENYHNNSKASENEHILPYCVHLCYNINYMRTGKTYLAEYLKRSLITKRIQEERNPNYVSDHILIDCVVLLVESDQASIGNIIEVYGDSIRLLSSHPKALIGKTPNYLLPSSMASYHNRIMNSYMSNPLKYFLGVQRDSFIRIPDTKFIQSSHIMLKVIPNMESNFRILVGVKPNQKKYNQKIIINPNFCVDCYSFNFLTILEDSFLTQNIPIKDLSKELFSFILQSNNELDNYKADVVGLKEKKDIVNNFNKNIAKELSKTKEVERHRGMENEETPDSYNANIANGAKEDLPNIFELRFYNKHRTVEVKKVFEISFEMKEFVNVNKRMIYLDMTLVDDNDHKISMIRKDEHFEMVPYQTSNEPKVIGSKTNFPPDGMPPVEIRISLCGVNQSASQNVVTGVTSEVVNPGQYNKEKRAVGRKPSIHMVIPNDPKKLEKMKSRDSLESLKGDVVDFKIEQVDEFYKERFDVDKNLQGRTSLLPETEGGTLPIPKRTFKFMKKGNDQIRQEEYIVPKKIFTESQEEIARRKQRAVFLLNELGVGIFRGIQSKKFINILRMNINRKITETQKPKAEDTMQKIPPSDSKNTLAVMSQIHLGEKERIEGKSGSNIFAPSDSITQMKQLDISGNAQYEPSSKLNL